MEHLMRGITSHVPDVKLDEFRMARSKFAELINLDPNQSTLGIENKYLICIGYWGNYCYFNLRQDPRSALIQVYECMAKYPLIGIEIFKEFISSDFSEFILDLKYIQPLMLEATKLPERISIADESKTKFRKFLDIAARVLPLQKSFYLNEILEKKRPFSNNFLFDFLEDTAIIYLQLTLKSKIIEAIEEQEMSLRYKVINECYERKRDLENLVI